MHDLTLQINLSAGDISYAQLTVPELVKAHRNNVDETLAIVDCCRPQKTKLVDPALKYSEPEFSQNIDRISKIAEELRDQGYLDRVIYLKPDNQLIPLITKKYLNNLVQGTHDFRGAGFMAYFVGLEAPNTRYVLHYDADMLLYQAPGYDWSVSAIESMNKLSQVVAVVPRTSPPFSQNSNEPDAPSLHEGRSFEESEDGNGWLNDWFNTQCFLIDRKKLDSYLPLIQGWTFLQFLVFKYIQNTLPKSPEMMLIRQVGGNGGRRLISKSEQAWILHPLTKPARYLELLPQILESVRTGKVPGIQKGQSNIDLMAWETFLTASSLFESLT